MFDAEKLAAALREIASFAAEYRACGNDAEAEAVRNRRFADCMEMAEAACQSAGIEYAS